LQGAPLGDPFSQQGSAFDFPPMTTGFPAFGSGAEASAFTIPPMGAVAPPSLLDLVQSTSQPSTPQKAPASTMKDPFATLSIDDIKRGFVSPSHVVSSTTASTIPTSPPSSLPVTPISPITPTLTPLSTVKQEEIDFSNLSSIAVQPSDPIPSTPVITSAGSLKQTPTDDVHQQTPTKTVEKKANAPKTAGDFLASINLNASVTPPQVEKPASAIPTPAFTNASMVKTTIDWSKQRDLMASFLSAPSATAISPQQQSSEHPTQNPSTGDDWTEYDAASAKETVESPDWSSFGGGGGGGGVVVVATSDGTITTGTTFVDHSSPTSLSIATEIVSSPPATVPDWEAFSAAATQGGAMMMMPTENVFGGIDSSSFDSTSWSPAHLGHPSNLSFAPQLSIAPIETILSTPISHQEGSISELTLKETQGKSDEKSPAVEQNDFAEFGGFTSSSAVEDDWSAFPEDNSTKNDQVSPRTAITAASHLNSEPLPSPSSRKRPGTKILDLSAFELPSLPSTPSKSDLKVNKETIEEQTAPIPSNPSFTDEIVSTSTNTSFSGDFSAFSGMPSNDLFSLGGSETPTPEIPAWMNSNRSNDTPMAPTSTSLQVEDTKNWQDQPTIDALKRQAVELLGNDKLASYVWIFDNFGKNITLTFQERHTLAAELIEDVKSGKVIWLSSSRVNQWHSVLTKCNEDLQRALSYLSNVAVQADMHPDEILTNYLSHEKTLSYLSALGKVYTVATRIMCAIRSNNGPQSQGQTPKTTCRYLKPSVLKALHTLGSTIEHSWKTLVEQVSEMVNSSGGSNNLTQAALSVSAPVPHAPLNFNCYICYRGFDEQEGPLQWQDKNCHATCTNFWTHRISMKPPTL
jgi:hypothetical protein